MSEHSVFDPSEREQDSVVRALLDDPTVGVVDTTLDQLASLRRLLPAMTGKTEELPRWVHYPWRRTLVRVLGPRSFDRLRLDRNRNKITSAEQARFRGLRVGVVGLSVGHAVAHTLALEGLCGELRLADFDELDLSNLNRVPSSVFDLGLNKAVVAARRIAELDPYLNVQVFADGVTAETLDGFLDGLDLVVEECDSIDTKLLVRHHARARGIPVVMETSDGGVLDVERFDLEPDRPVFHGLLGEMKTADVSDLTVEQKSTIAATLLEPTKLTPRMIASVPEIGRTISTWPQLGGDVALGGAAVTAAVRAFGRGEPLPSGRRRIDLDALVRTGVDPTAGPAGG
ncbi:UBA/THIF-type NAD/FAD binding protein [Rhodococcus sp. AW25M09]|uniref:Rv1355c family protein n=1 Tax=Rhodococcus sp. AW25M09 TaxID=1268303 RepID=UPI0002AD0C82|nr:Rv1355c family protein [Rhodococcus sp. AW25M09]CCQ18468.1 UBA/THIF-type NAD/FAD binding protein [Rhodococcus sp. AW25M09]